MALAGTEADRGGASLFSDNDVVERVRAGDTALFEILMRRYNQRVYRTARAILRDDAEAEDVMQEAYVRAYAHLDQFEGRASFATWLTRIAVHEALARARRRGRHASLDEETMTEEQSAALPQPGPGPEEQLAGRELRSVLERAIDGLAPAYRSVFMLREVEGLTTSEAAACLEVSEEVVKTRLHRARGQLRRTILDNLGSATSQAFPFGFQRCDRVVAAVLGRISAY